MRAGRRYRAGAPAAGAAVVEFALLGTMIFGALTQLVVIVGMVHRATLATTAAAREAGRAVAVADGELDLARRLDAVLASAARNHGLAPGSLMVAVDGDRRRGALVRVRVRTEVPVLRVPFVGGLPGPVLPVEATYTLRVDRYRSLP